MKKSRIGKLDAMKMPFVQHTCSSNEIGEDEPKSTFFFLNHFPEYIEHKQIGGKMLPARMTKGRCNKLPWPRERMPQIQILNSLQLEHMVAQVEHNIHIA